MEKNLTTSKCYCFNSTMTESNVLQPKQSLDSTIKEIPSTSLIEQQLHIITVATEEKYYLPYLKIICKKFNNELKILGLGSKWQGFSYRIDLIIKYLRTIDPNDIVCFIDGYDVICIRDINELINEFKKIINNKLILIGVDRHSTKNKLLASLYFKKVDNNFINAGSYMGYAKKLLIVLEEIYKSIDNFNNDDQILLIDYCKKNPESYILDINNNIFLCYLDSLKEIDDKLYIMNDTVYYKNSKPFFIHGPGFTYLNNILIKTGFKNTEYLQNIKLSYKKNVKNKTLYYVLNLLEKYKIIFIITYLIIFFMIYKKNR
jgi:hypothetical protein